MPGQVYTSASEMSLFDNSLAFPHALGTGLIISSRDTNLDIYERLKESGVIDKLQALIAEFDGAFSRFRPDSLVSKLARGTACVTFPEYASELFDIYDTLFAASFGHFRATIAEKLITLGYGESFTTTKYPKYPKTEAPAVWGTDIWREHEEPNVLHISRPVQLDFGAAGKGFLIDLMAREIAPVVEHFTINAGGDIYSTEALMVGLENPWNTKQAVGTLKIDQPAALCASAPGRRHWQTIDEATHVQREVHHLLDGLSGEPVRDIVAAWSYVPGGVTFSPAAWADALSTALFVCDPDALLGVAPRGWQFARILGTKNAQQSYDWPGEFFVE